MIKFRSLKVYSKNQMHVTLLLYSHNCKKVWCTYFSTPESVGLTGVTLANLDLLMRSLEFIEEHLEDTVAVQTENIAAACYASKESVCGTEDVVFRIGGDEFALLTNSRDQAYAQELKEKILAMNGQIIQFEGKDIPLSLYAKTVKIEDKTVRYAEMFPKLMIPDTEKTN